MKIELPAELRAQIAAEVARRVISEADWFVEAAREKVAASAQRSYLEQRAARGGRGALKRILAQVPADEPMPGDER
ncbi:MAG: hypothetical protein K2W96_16660 [Gemmataceae bacterium]|nr:hypothetical protein [Gemmataceae bacterium]